MAALHFGMVSLRRPLRLAAAAGLAAMLFAQAALVLAACKLEGGAPSRGAALAMTVTAEPAAACHEEGAAIEALCVAHCQAGEQTLDKYQAKLPLLAVHLLPAFVVRAVPWPAVTLPLDPVPVASPPARILFQSLLI